MASEKRKTFSQSLGASWQWAVQRACAITKVRATAIVSQRQACDFSGSKCCLTSLDSYSCHHWSSSQLHNRIRRDRFTKETVSDPEATVEALSCSWMGPGMLAGGRDMWGSIERFPSISKVVVPWASVLPWDTGRETGRQQLTSMLPTKGAACPFDSCTHMSKLGHEAASVPSHRPRHPSGVRYLLSYS